MIIISNEPRDDRLLRRLVTLGLGVGQAVLSD